MRKDFKLRNTELSIIAPEDFALDLPEEYQNMSMDSAINRLIEKLIDRINENDPGNNTNTGTNSKCQVPADAALQYECGDCCKKAIQLSTGGRWTVDLINNRFSCGDIKVLVKTFNDGKLIDKQVVDALTVRELDFFCLFEFGVLELDPEEPVNVGLSKLAFEVDCGPCCKKILNAKKELILGPFSFIFPERGEALIVKTFNGGKLVETQCVLDFAFTLTDRICSIEENALEIDP